MRPEIAVALGLIVALMVCTLVLWARTYRAQRYLREAYPDVGAASGLGVPLFGALLLRHALRRSDHPALRDPEYEALDLAVWRASVAERALFVAAIGLGVYGSYTGL